MSENLSHEFHRSELCLADLRERCDPYETLLRALNNVIEQRKAFGIGHLTASRCVPYTRLISKPQPSSSATNNRFSPKWPYSGFGMQQIRLHFTPKSM